MKSILVSFCLVSCATASEQPRVEMPILSGKSAEVSCHGYGISIDFARQDAIERCQGSVAAYLSRDVKVADENWETSNGAYAHTKVSSVNRVKNLECKVLTEDVTLRVGTAEVAMRCRFDLSKAIVTSEIQPESRGDTAVRISRERKIVVASIPPCEKITTIGPHGKTYTCTGNPFQFTSYADDRELIVEREGFLPFRQKLVNDELLTTITVRLQTSD